MRTKEQTISIRVPTEIFVKLKQYASSNQTTLSEVARDLIMQGLTTDTEEHTFLSRVEWGKAVKERDNFRCAECGDIRNLTAHHILPCYQGGKNILSNGITLCLSCHEKRHQTRNHIRQDIPEEWAKRLYRAQYRTDIDENVFWREQLACFYTRRKRAGSTIVKNYVLEYLEKIEIRIIRDTLFSLCPTPTIIESFPSRHLYRKIEASETFPVPEFVYLARQELGQDGAPSVVPKTRPDDSGLNPDEGTGKLPDSLGSN